MSFLPSPPALPCLFALTRPPGISAAYRWKPGRAAVPILVGALLGLALSHGAIAEGTPATTPPAAKPMPQLIPNPGEIMSQMARELDKHPDQGVFVLETLKITQGEVADVIRTMPVAMASLGYNEVFKRAVDTMVAQKAMVLNALKQGLDKDPIVIRKSEALHERAMADAWLSRIGDAAATDQALHARYDRDIAGKPGPTEVRARLILVPTQDEAASIIEKAQNGADFADLARANSKDGSAGKGGDLGYASMDALSPEIGPVAFALQLGQITAFPMRSQAGYFILRVEGRRQRGTPTFDEARPRLEAALRAEAIAASIQDVLSHIKIVPVAAPAPGGAPAPAK
jgi:peptidyl-prolyl cis-trans isomerase C